MTLVKISLYYILKGYEDVNHEIIRKHMLKKAWEGWHKFYEFFLADCNFCATYTYILQKDKLKNFWWHFANFGHLFSEHFVQSYLYCNIWAQSLLISFPLQV